MANKFSDLWQRRDTDGERHIIEHIRRNGYIDHDTLGGVCLTEGIGDRVPCLWVHEEDMRHKRWERRYAELARQARESIFPNVTPKHSPDF